MHCCNLFTECGSSFKKAYISLKRVTTMLVQEELDEGAVQRNRSEGTVNINTT